MTRYKWVFWVDSDIIVSNYEFDLRNFINGKEQVFTFDHTNFLFNSGLMGFYQSEHNIQRILNICKKIESLPNLTNVYSHGGDQQFFCDTFFKNSDYGLHNIVSSRLVEHCPLRNSSNSWLWHSPDLNVIYRAASMKIKTNYLNTPSNF